MKQYCKLTGVNLAADGATNGIKQMCLNCKFSNENNSDDGQIFSCDNENVMQVGVSKVINSLPEGFEIETLKLKPMKLKDPTKKCSNYVFDLGKVENFLVKWFEPAPDSEKEKEN